MAYNTCQFSSVAQSCPPLCDLMDCSTPGSPVHHQLPDLSQTHVHIYSFIYIYIYIYIYIVICVCMRGERFHIGHQCVCAQSCPALCGFTARLHCPWNFPGKNTGVACHFLLQRIFPIQELNPYLCLLLWQVDSLPLVPPGKPTAQNNTRIL